LIVFETLVLSKYKGSEYFTASRCVTNCGIRKVLKRPCSVIPPSREN